MINRTPSPSHSITREHHDALSSTSTTLTKHPRALNKSGRRTKATPSHIISIAPELIKYIIKNKNTPLPSLDYTHHTKKFLDKKTDKIDTTPINSQPILTQLILSANTDTIPPQQKQTLTEQNKTNKEKNKFSCDHCDKSYTRKWNKNKHIIIHTNSKSLTCSICKKILSSTRNLTNHMKTHKLSNNLTCNIDQNMSLQTRSNRGTKNNSKHNHFKYKFCSKRFDIKNKLNNNIKLSHFKKMNFACNICSKTFQFNSNLIRHIETHKTKKNNFTCDICSIHFKKESTFLTHKIKHINLISNPNKSLITLCYSCSDCDYRSSSNQKLQRHKKHLHTKTLISLKCTICLKDGYRYKSSLDRHTKNIHNIHKPKTRAIPFLKKTSNPKNL